MSDFYNIFRATAWSIADTRHIDAGQAPPAPTDPFAVARLYHIHSGQATVTLTDGRLTMTAGHTYLIPAYQFLAEVRGDGATYDVVCLVPNLLTEHLLPLSGYARELTLPPDLTAHLFGMIVPSGGASMSAESALRLILSLFAESTNADFLLAGTDIGRFLPVFDYVDRHVEGSVGLAELAALTSASKVYFSNLFKKTFSLSPQQYVLQRKADAARRLLARGELSVTEIAAALGFYDPAAFTAFFKKNAGMTPKAFRAWVTEKA